VATANNLAHARQVTTYKWVYINRLLIIVRDRDGSENTFCYNIDIDTGHELALIDQPGIRSFIRCESRDHPTEVLLGLNARDRRCFDALRVDVTTGASHLVFQNPGYFGLLFDDTLTVRLAFRVREDGSAEILQIAPDGSIRQLLDVAPDDFITTSAWGFSRDRFFARQPRPQYCRLDRT
jgi:hypothetical protein